MTTALVLSGGANLGAAQVGMMMALQESGVRPDLVIGTSVGALNGAWVAADAPLDDWATCGARCDAVTCSRQTHCAGSSASLVAATIWSVIGDCGCCCASIFASNDWRTHRWHSTCWPPTS